MEDAYRLLSEPKKGDYADEDEELEEIKKDVIKMELLGKATLDFCERPDVLDKDRLTALTYAIDESFRAQNRAAAFRIRIQRKAGVIVKELEEFLGCNPIPIFRNEEHCEYLMMLLEKRIIELRE